jgi:hypothetical protein
MLICGIMTYFRVQIPCQVQPNRARYMADAATSTALVSGRVATSTKVLRDAAKREYFKGFLDQAMLLYRFPPLRTLWSLW